MGQPVCRTGDEVIGTCYGHSSPRSFTGHWTSSDGNVSANELRIIVAGDIGDADCGHQFVAVGGSVGVNKQGILLQRVGDQVVQPEGAGYSLTGQSTTGSNNVTST